MLILLSFVLAWAEVWFFDFRLIPLERKAREIWEGRRGEETERTPLLAPSQTVVERFLQGSTLYEGSVGNFYSPLQSPGDSGDEDEDEELVVAGVRVPSKFIRRKDKVLTGQEREFIKTGEEVLATALRIINSGDWKVERRGEAGDLVQVRQCGGKKIFRLSVSQTETSRQCLTLSLCRDGSRCPPPDSWRSCTTAWRTSPPGTPRWRRPDWCRWWTTPRTSPTRSVPRQAAASSPSETS